MVGHGPLFRLDFTQKNEITRWGRGIILSSICTYEGDRRYSSQRALSNVRCSSLRQGHRSHFPKNQRNKVLKHGAIPYNEAEVFSLSITNTNRRPMLPFDWLIHLSLLAGCQRILFLCGAGFLRLRNKFENLNS